MKLVAGHHKVIDFGLRRAQGLGGIQASKAAFIGGVEATSNVYSAFHYDIPASGTMAHSWIQSFEDELTAFRKYAEFYPDSCILLVDTYNTLKSGVPNAIKVAKELEGRGHKLVGIRLDSGDLAYFSRKARQMFDDAGLDYVKIAASNQLDEHLIKSLLAQNAPIDLFGVGTRLVTAKGTPALDGVYKLVSVNNQPKLKISENVEKITLPGQKKTIRYFTAEGDFYADGVILREENEKKQTIYHPHHLDKYFKTNALKAESLMRPVMENGEILINPASPSESAEYAKRRLKKLTTDHKRFENPHIYKVGVSKRLNELRDELIEKFKAN
jgi:nicotinate phosphoribosyltransferase